MAPSRDFFCDPETTAARLSMLRRTFTLLGSHGSRAASSRERHRPFSPLRYDGNDGMRSTQRALGRENYLHGSPLMYWSTLQPLTPVRSRERGRRGWAGNSRRLPVIVPSSVGCSGDGRCRCAFAGCLGGQRSRRAAKESKVSFVQEGRFRHSASSHSRTGQMAVLKGETPVT